MLGTSSLTIVRSRLLPATLGKLLSAHRFLANRIRSIWRRFRIRTLLLRHDGGEIQRTVAASDRRTPLTDRQGMLPMQLAA